MMHDPPIEGTEFAFVLPLQWPQNTQERETYERALIDYAVLMQPLLEGAEGDQRQELFDVLSPFAVQLRSLWGATPVPPEIGQFLAMFE